MLGDVLLMTEKHKAIARELAMKLAGRQGLKTSICVGGESGSGKSEVAEALREELRSKKLRVKILHLDNYYLVPPSKRNQHRKKFGTDSVGFREINWNLVQSNIDSFYKGQQTLLPFLDLFTNQEDLLYSNLKLIDILILEGLYACHYPGDIKLYIDLSYHETWNAQVARKKEEMNSFRVKVLEKERSEVLDTRYQADFFVSPSYKLVKNIHHDLVLNDTKQISIAS